MNKNQKGFLPFVGLLGFGVLIIAFGIAFGIVLLRQHEGVTLVDGPAMEPAIHSGQQVTVHKYAEGHTPQRGDVVEYSSTNSLVKKYSSSGKLLHRVVALPGERVKISNNSVMVYNSQNPKGFNPDSTISSTVKTYPDMDVVVPANTYFVLGDNRPNALDSRVLGSIPLRDIIGKVSY